MENIKELAQKVSHLDVIYAEDELDVREESARFFKRFFPNLRVAENGEEAWKLYEEKPCDLLITDLKMPILNGNELMKKIKATSSETITVLISGISMQIDEEVVADYKLSKPVNFVQFTEFLEELLSKN